jgi:hypothetical protein
MKRITPLVTAVALLCLYAAAASAQEPKELDPKVVQGSRLRSNRSAATATQIGTIVILHFIGFSPVFSVGPSQSYSSGTWIMPVDGCTLTAASNFSRDGLP